MNEVLVQINTLIKILIEWYCNSKLAKTLNYYKSKTMHYSSKNADFGISD